MKLLEGLEAAAEIEIGRGAAVRSLQQETVMESPTHCAYNQTRECFLGLEVKAGDLPLTRIGEIMSARPLKSGEGVWMTPFRGIPAAAMPAPLDLIYLDEDCRVIDTVESFPTFQVKESSPWPESVLALPAHSIYSSQTQPGDQLVLCVAEEMGRQLQRLSNPRIDPVEISSTIAGAVVLREKPLWSGGPGLLELEDRSVRVSEQRMTSPDTLRGLYRCSIHWLRVPLLCCRLAAGSTTVAARSDVGTGPRRRRRASGGWPPPTGRGRCRSGRT